MAQSGWPDHFCPACATPLRAFPRYPWHLCNDCRRQAADAHGRRLEFANASASGGLVWRYVGEENWQEGALRVRCLVRRRPVIVHEARFGGVVAEPDHDTNQTGHDGMLDLSRKAFLSKE